jgi:hypothetical protein
MCKGRDGSLRSQMTVLGGIDARLCPFDKDCSHPSSPDTDMASNCDLRLVRVVISLTHTMSPDLTQSTTVRTLRLGIVELSPDAMANSLFLILLGPMAGK